MEKIGQEGVAGLENVVRGRKNRRKRGITRRKIKGVILRKEPLGGKIKRR